MPVPARIFCIFTKIKIMAAFTITSDINPTKSPIKNLYEFLGDFKNFDSILPHDKIEDFKFNENECSFNIKGITPMTIKMAEKSPHESILFTSEGLAKFNFNLKVHFIGDASSAGECKVELMGDLNPFIKTMAEKPLTTLVNTMSEKLSELQVN
ncbi:MAG: hypothetical protein K0S32_3983 [Bacteroidetes bacterium]|nr:hypothetical protein [Bacteroidota bacterium]